MSDTIAHNTGAAGAAPSTRSYFVREHHPENGRRMMCLSLFWHFLDVIWIGVFTFVYLMGVLP